MISRICTLICAFIFLPMLLSAQEASDKLGTWFVYNGIFDVNKKYELFMETQYRSWEPVHNMSTWFVRPFFSYRVTENFIPGIGFEYHINRSFTEIDAERISLEEFRITPQVIALQKVGVASLQHRYRYEFRFWDFKGRQRVRYRIQASIPITSKKMETGVFFATIGNEFFMSTKPEMNFSQDWWYVMGGYRISPNMFVQAGYLGIILPNRANLSRLQFMFIHSVSL